MCNLTAPFAPSAGIQPATSALTCPSPENGHSSLWQLLFDLHFRHLLTTFNMERSSQLHFSKMIADVYEHGYADSKQRSIPNRQRLSRADLSLQYL